MDEIEKIMQSVPGKWQAYEAIKRELREKELDWMEYQEKIQYAAERLGL